MAQYTTKEEIIEARKLHSSFFILKSGDSIEGNLVPTIQMILANSANAEITISDGDSDSETITLLPERKYCGPFGLSTGYNQNASKSIACSGGEVLVEFSF